MLLDGQALATQIRTKLQQEIAQLKKKPCLATILVGDDQASRIYIQAKIKACQTIGIQSLHHDLSVNVPPTKLHQLIDNLNKNPDVHGILLQLPLPKHVDTTKILEAIHPDKDVDGLHPTNAGKLLQSKTIPKDMLLPCTPRGIVKLIEQTGATIYGKHVVIVGRSQLVGKPIALLCLAHNATVSICHSKTGNLIEITKQADILIAAVGHPLLIGKEHIQPGTIVIDVGINRDGKKLIGDVDFDQVHPIASWITPVPGGVGPMTIACLLENTIIAYHLQEGK